MADGGVTAMRTVRRSNRRALAIALAPVVFLAGCGTGGNLPSGGSLPGSIAGSIGTLPSRPTPTTPPPTSTTTTTPTTTTSQPPTTTTPPTTQPPTTAASTAPPPGTTSQASGDETPWGWIALGAGLLLAAVLTAGWLLGRRRESRKAWHASMTQAAAEGLALHDAALATAIGSASANRRAEWSTHVARAGALAAELRRLEQAAPGAEDAQSAATAATAVDSASSAMEVASTAPAGAPLDEAAGRMLRERLEDMLAAFAPFRAPPA